jgi:hypothetical protein
VPGERISTVNSANGKLNVSLADGRKLRVPLAWFNPLFKATPAQRANFYIRGDGYRIHWPEISFELSSARLLRGPILGDERR